MDWHKRKPTKRDKQIVTELIKSIFPINRVLFPKRDIGCRGYCAYSHKTKRLNITLNLNRHTDRRDLYSTIMHELAHGICFKQRIYPSYHYSKPEKKLTRKEKKAICNTALRAELYVDRMGERMFSKFFPKLNYKRGYRTKESRKFLRLYWQQMVLEH